jgi:hypothetical protein
LRRRSRIDSRAGDPDLHTHVAVANKVQTLNGRWLSIDGRMLFKATVAASETYNTALERHLSDRLGVRLADRPDTDPRKRPVREIVGVHPALMQRWSTRRALIKDRQGELAARFQRDHGRPPTPVEALQNAPPDHSIEIAGEWRLGVDDSGPGAGCAGGAPFDLAKLACPRRGATPDPGR